MVRASDSNAEELGVGRRRRHFVKGKDFQGTAGCETSHGVFGVRCLLWFRVFQKLLHEREKKGFPYPQTKEPVKNESIRKFRSEKKNKKKGNCHATELLARPLHRVGLFGFVYFMNSTRNFRFVIFITQPKPEIIGVV